MLLVVVLLVVGAMVVVVEVVVVGTIVVVDDVVLADVDTRLLVPAGDSAVREDELLGASHPAATRNTVMIGSVTSLVNGSATRDRDATSAVCQRPSSSSRSIASGRHIATGESRRSVEHRSPTEALRARASDQLVAFTPPGQRICDMCRRFDDQGGVGGRSRRHREDRQSVPRSIARTRRRPAAPNRRTFSTSPWRSRPRTAARIVPSSMSRPRCPPGHVVAASSRWPRIRHGATSNTAQPHATTSTSVRSCALDTRWESKFPSHITSRWPRVSYSVAERGPGFPGTLLGRQKTSAPRGHSEGAAQGANSAQV